jgi:hypothetical protein
MLKLELDRNRISDAGAKHIGKALEHNTTLAFLKLRYNVISDAGVASLVRGILAPATNGMKKKVRIRIHLTPTTYDDDDDDDNDRNLSNFAVRGAWES